jgi:hypothetical protein
MQPVCFSSVSVDDRFNRNTIHIGTALLVCRAAAGLELSGLNLILSSCRCRRLEPRVLFDMCLLRMAARDTAARRSSFRCLFAAIHSDYAGQALDFVAPWWERHLGCFYAWADQRVGSLSRYLLPVHIVSRCNLGWLCPLSKVRSRPIAALVVSDNAEHMDVAIIAIVAALASR